MRKIHIAFSFVALAIFNFTSFAQRSNCPVSPEPYTHQLSNGNSLTLISKGNEAVHYLETSDGYTVLKNEKGIFEYAIIGPDGNLTLSGIAAQNNAEGIPAFGKNSIAKHLRYSKNQTDMLIQYHNQLDEVKNTGLGKAGGIFPPTGNRKIVVLLVQYPNLPATISVSNFNLLFNQPNFSGTGSFKDYYLKSTYGQLNITTDVYGWFMADSGYKYYGKSSSPNYSLATRNLLIGAINAADSAVNFANYDTDNDGIVDAIMILHAGLGAEESSLPNSGDYIWSFRSTLSSSSSPTKDGKKFSAYAMFPEKRSNGGLGGIVGIGVISHEFGHILDLPDLYATNFNGSAGPEGVGNYAIMAGGGWIGGEKVPCMHDAWSKMQLGWLTPVTITAPGIYTIPKGSVDSNFAYRINTTRSNEYFLIESRQRKGQDLYLPGRGLAIWHANTQKAGKLSVAGNNANNDTSNLGLGLMQADGERDLEFGNNRGDGGDLYPGTSNNKAFTPNTNPGSQLYYKVGTTRQNSNIYITNITLNPDSSMSFRFGATATADFSPNAAIGCAPFTVSFTNTSFFANSYQWSFGNGQTSTTTNPQVTYTTAGNYTVWLKALDSSGNAVDSTSQIINVYNKPVANFTVTRVDSSKITITNNSQFADYYQWQFKSFSSGSASLPLVNLKDLADTGSITFVLIAYSNAGCQDTFKKVIPVVSAPTALAEQSSAPMEVSVYPNPSHQDIHIQSSRTVDRVSVYSVVGEELLSIQVRQSDFTISTEQLLSRGIYFLKLESGINTKVLKIVRE
jgi:M6 family metalloprotease-like protein